MRSRSPTYIARKLHRYLGLFIGVQFTLWTLGGLYFSWTDLDEVHGDDLRAPVEQLPGDLALASPAAALAEIRAREPVDSLASLELIRVLGEPVYRIDYFTEGANGAARRVRLADAATGRLRAAVSRQEALRIARTEFLPDAPVEVVEYLTPGKVGRHHEYREQPLPAWAVSFAHPSSATVYVPAEGGSVQRVRNQRWRIFDFLWMLHTMDYVGRDDFNNRLLRTFSVLGLLTIASGFALFGLTSPMYRRRSKPRARDRTATKASR